MDVLKKRLCSAPSLHCANPNLPYELTADASGTCAGAELAQTDESRSRPVPFTSRKLNETGQQYITSEREFLSIISAVRACTPHLRKSKCAIQSKVQSLKYLDV